MKIISFTILFLAIITTSCKKIRDDLLPEVNTKMYCQSILNPDSVIRVYVGRTTEILNNKPSFIDDATVLLYTNSIFSDTLTNAKNGTYLSNVRPSEGELYTIEVIQNGTLKGSTIIPHSIELIEPKIDFPAGYDAVNQQYYGDLTFTIDDDPNVQNFYEVVIFTKSQSSFDKKYTYQYRNDPNYILVPDKIVQNEGDWDYFPTSLFFCDKLFNGKKQLLSFSIATGYGIENDLWFSDLEKNGYILLRCISSEYYLYRKYYTRHAYNSQVHSDGIGNMLFTGEPLDMYSNVTGGLGVVAAFSSTISKIKRK